MLLWILILSSCATTAPSPMENFLSARAVRCALASGDWRAGWGTRRQTVTPQFTKGVSAQENLQLHAPNYNLGPQKSPVYDPNWGYEPYWADGAWVFHPSANATPQPYEYCGSLCAPSFLEYGEICAKNGEGKYMTFKNYCDLKASDCTDEQRWKIVYKGSCIESGDNEQFKGRPGYISVKYTLAKPQPGIRKEIVQRFYDLYKLPIGGSLHNGTTKAYTYTETYTDY